MLLPVAVVVFAALVSLYLLCVYKPELVLSVVQRSLVKSTGLPWRIKGHIRPVLTPAPGLTVTDVSLIAASSEQSFYANSARPLVQVGALRLFAEPASLLSSSPRLRLIEFIDPVVNLAYDLENRPLWLPPETLGKPPADPATAGEAATLDALKLVADALCELPPLARQPVVIRNGSVISYTSDGSLLLSFTGIDGLFEPEAAEENLRLGTSFALPDADLTVKLFLGARLGHDGVPAEGRIYGQLDMTPPGSRTLAADFESSFIWQSGGRNVRMPNFRILAETDMLTADLTADLAVPECTGKVSIHKLSLPRWFEFGRVLPPGLRQVLDGLVGEFDLQLDRKRAEARNLRGVAGPLAVTGYVGTPDFSTPVVVVDLDLDRANLDLVFPFLAAVGRFVPDPVPPVFDHPPLAPYPQDPAAPPPPDATPGIEVSYDVSVRVARPRVHDVNTGPLSLTVLPAVVDAVEKTRVAFSLASVLEGSVDGRLDIDASSILMHYDAKGLEMRHLPENADNAVKVAGKVTGICEIDVPILADSNLADDWTMRVDATVKGLEITGHYAASPWRLYAASAKSAGQGPIHAVQSDGIRIEGAWDLSASGIATSWNPEGKEHLDGTFEGALRWLAMPDAPGRNRRDLRKVEKRGVERVDGKLDLNGTLTVPFGSVLKPLAGKFGTGLDWHVHGDTIRLGDSQFEGFGSVVEADTTVDFSGKGVNVSSETHFRINPRTLLRGWDMPLPESVGAPQILSGKASVKAQSGVLHFDRLKFEADGAPLSGEVRWQGKEADAEAAEAGQWTIRLAAEHLDLDTYFPPSTPLPAGQRPPPASTKPWDLSFAKDLSVDAQLVLANAKKDNLTLGPTKVTAALQRDRFSLYAESSTFYGGKATLLFQGTVVPERSLVTLRKGLAQIDDADLGRLLYDYSKETGYGGKASLLYDVSGTMTCDADVPGQLSGVWNLSIVDGLYPAFLTGQDSTLRNTFSQASAGGLLEKGVLRSNNFRLSGAMVDMNGGGWFNLVNKEYDVEISVTFAKIPTVPVRFYGSAYAPRMRVRGVDMVVETVQNVGSTAFGLVKGVLMLPAQAVMGIGNLFGGDGGNKKQPARTMPIAPMRQQTGNPGQ